MSPVSLTLDLMLAALLLITLGFGLRLDKRLKALNESQAAFAAAVAELDQAAARAESGLADLRTAMDEAVGLLAGRIEKARELAGRLEALTTQGATTQGAAAPERPAPANARSALDRIWARPSRSVRPADSAAEGESENAALTLTRADALSARRPAQLAPAQHSRAPVDDELFDGPARRRLAGGRL